MMIMCAAGTVFTVSVAVHDEGCGTGGQADIGLGMGVGELSTRFDAATVFRLPGAIGVDGPAAAHMGSESTEPGALTTSEETTEMIDDPTPVEQARAARWAVEFLDKRVDRLGPSVIVGVNWAKEVLSKHADEMDPPETVESLRADVAHAENAADALRAELYEANAALARLRSTHAEAEATGARAQRKPQVWCEGDHEPPVTAPSLQLLDKRGHRWTHRRTAGWCCYNGRGERLAAGIAWRELLQCFGPLTEARR